MDLRHLRHMMQINYQHIVEYKEDSAKQEILPWKSSQNVKVFLHNKSKGQLLQTHCKPNKIILLIMRNATKLNPRIETNVIPLTAGNLVSSFFFILFTIGYIPHQKISAIVLYPLQS